MGPGGEGSFSKSTLIQSPSSGEVMGTPSRVRRIPRVVRSSTSRGGVSPRRLGLGRLFVVALEGTAPAVGHDLAGRTASRRWTVGARRRRNGGAVGRKLESSSTPSPPRRIGHGRRRRAHTRSRLLGNRPGPPLSGGTGGRACHNLGHRKAGAELPPTQHARGTLSWRTTIRMGLSASSGRAGRVENVRRGLSGVLLV